jgi:D-alanine-D-alanine ligase
VVKRGQENSRRADFGGQSSEHEVSLASAQSVANALDKDKYEVIYIGITKQGRWITSGNPMAQLVAATNSPLLKASPVEEPVPPAEEIAQRELVERAGGSRVSPFSTVDVIFPLLHGPFGEDGTMQGLLELADVPYVGAGVAASAVGMDKALMKDIFRAQGLPVTDYVVVLRSEWQAQPELTIQRIEGAIAYPCFAKPANLGSSVGVSKARNWDELTEALNTAAKYDRKILVERAVIGREIECSVLGYEQPIAAIPGEVVPQREFYDYIAKYADENTQLIVPADLPEETRQRVQELAIAAFRAIDCSGMARVDFFVEAATGRVIVNEINTIPGFTAVSMYPRMWGGSGLTYSQLIDRLIELALERYADKKKNVI